MTYIVNDLDTRISKLQNDMSASKAFENVENFLRSLNKKLRPSDTLIIFGDIKAIKYLPKYFRCDVSIVISRKSLTDFYSSRWNYMQQGYKNVYHIHKFYVYDSQELVI